MTTVHSYTNDQKVLDLPDHDLRKARAAAVSIIPTTTGAIRTLAAVLPELKDKIDGFAMRVPTPNVSVIDLVVETKKNATKEAVNNCLIVAAEKKLKGILSYSREPLVSVDFMSNPASSIVDTELTTVVGGNLVKVISWYDNESGYSARIADLVEFIASSLHQ